MSAELRGWGGAILFLPGGEVFNLEKIDSDVIKEHIFTEYELHLIRLYLCKYKSATHLMIFCIRFYTCRSTLRKKQSSLIYLCKYKVTLIGNRKLYEATSLLGHYQPLSL